MVDEALSAKTDQSTKTKSFYLDVVEFIVFFIDYWTKKLEQVSRSTEQRSYISKVFQRHFN